MDKTSFLSIKIIVVFLFANVGQLVIKYQYTFSLEFQKFFFKINIRHSQSKARPVVYQ